jgi:hypothetical protein
MASGACRCSPAIPAQDRGDAQKEDHVLDHPRSTRSKRLLAPLVLTLVVAAIAIAPAALAASGTVVGTISPSSVPAGAAADLSFTLKTTSGQVSSFNLTAPTGWTITSLTPQTGISLVGSQIQGRNITATSSTTLTVLFSVRAPCAPATAAWTLAARSGGGFTGSSFAVDPTSSLSTPLSGTCTAAFVADPTDAAFNGGTTSENITSERFVPAGPDLQVLVKDAGSPAAPRAGISITLELSTNPTAATLSGPITATSDANGIATFHGTSVAPLTISKLGLGYVITPTGAGVVGVDPDPIDPIGIYREGEPCPSGQTCVVNDNISDPKLGASVTSSNPGDLGVLVVGFTIDCTGYTELSTSEIAWKFTGDGAQIVTATVSKALSKQVLDRGSSHIDVCFQTDPGRDPFVPKGGGPAVNTGLLADCNSTITTNCILSETAAPGGGRLITFTVEDGKGRI